MGGGGRRRQRGRVADCAFEIKAECFEICPAEMDPEKSTYIKSNSDIKHF